MQRLTQLPNKRLLAEPSVSVENAKHRNARKPPLRKMTLSLASQSQSQSQPTPHGSHSGPTLQEMIAIHDELMKLQHDMSTKMINFDAPNSTTLWEAFLAFRSSALIITT